jgi:hypothetical protein
VRDLAAAKSKLSQQQAEESHPVADFLRDGVHQHAVDLVMTTGVQSSPPKSETRKDFHSPPQSWQLMQQVPLHLILRFRQYLEMM